MSGTIKVVANNNVIIKEDIPEGLNKDTCFRLASVTKQFTAISLLILVDEGIVALNDQVKEYIPELNWSKSSLFHLLAHTSDIEDCYHLVDEDVEYQNIDLLPLIQSNGHKPGQQYIYNNTGYDLIPIIVERVLNISFTTFLHYRIFNPLHMTRTYTLFQIDTVLNVADCYCAETGIKYDYHHLNMILGSGGIYSCVNDLLKWNLAFPSLISHQLLQLAQTEITPNYGLGFEVYDDHVAHSGCWEGYNTYLAFYPKDKLSVIVLSNIDDTDADAIGRKVVLTIK